MADRIITVRLRALIDGFKKPMDDAAKATQGVVSAGKDVAKLGPQVSALGDTLTKRLSVPMATLGTDALVMGGAMLAGFAFATNAALGFDKQLSELSAVSGATGDELGRLRDQAIAAGAATVFSAKQAAQAQSELAKAGVSTADILSGGLNGALNLASAGNLELGRAAEIAASAMTTFSLRGKDVERVADALAAGANKSAANVEDIGQALQQSGLVADQFGLSMEQTVGVLSMFAQSGLRGSDAGTSFKTMLQRLVPQSAEAAQTMHDLGIEMFDANGKFVGIDQAAQELQSSLSGLTQEQRAAALTTLFGADAIRAATIFYEGGAKGVQSWTQQVTDSGYAAEIAAKRMDNLSGDLENLRGSIETALIKGGSEATGVLRAMAQEATNLVNGVSQLPEPIQQFGIGLAGAGGGVLVLLGGLGTLLPKLEKGREAMRGMGAAGAFLDKNLGSLAVASAGAVVGLTVLSDALGNSKRQAVELEQSLKEGLDLSTFSGLRDQAQRLDDKLTDLEHTSQAAGGFFGGLKNVIRGTVETLTPLPNTVLDTAEALNTLIPAWEQSEAALLHADENLNGIANTLGVTRREAESLAIAAGVDLTGGFSEVVGAVSAYQHSTQGGTQSTQDFSGALQTLDSDASSVTDQLKAFKSAIDAVFAQFDPQKALDAFESGLNAVGDELSNADDKVKRAEQRIAELNAQTDKGAGFAQEMADAQKELADAQEDSSRSLDGNTDAAIRNRRFVMDQAEAIGDVIYAMRQEGATVTEQIATRDRLKQQLIDVARQYGLNADAVGVLIAAVDAIPIEHVTTVTADTNDAKARLDALKQQMLELKELGISIGLAGDTFLPAGGGNRGTVARREGGVTYHAASGLLSRPHIASRPSFGYAEPGTGGEAFIPRFGLKDMGVLGTAAQWYGQRLSPITAGGSQMVDNHTDKRVTGNTFNLTVDDAQRGPQELVWAMERLGQGIV